MYKDLSFLILFLFNHNLICILTIDKKYSIRATLGFSFIRLLVQTKHGRKSCPNFGKISRDRTILLHSHWSAAHFLRFCIIYSISIGGIFICYLFYRMDGTFFSDIILANTIAVYQILFWCYIFFNIILVFLGYSFCVLM